MTSHTQGEARLATKDDPAFAEDLFDCVVMVGDRQILECYEDGEAQTSEDAANAARIVKAWNAHEKLVEALREALRAWEKPNATHTPTYRKNYERLTNVLRELGEVK